jgi:DNA-binding IclR family transcriptional regulator
MSEKTPDPADDRSTGSRIAVIDKAVRVMDAILTSADGLTPTEVAAATETNRSTAFRLLVSLEQAGLLTRDATEGRYKLGIKLMQYGEAVRSGMSIVDALDPTMRELRDETRQSVLLAVREGWGARCIHRLSGPEVDVLSWATGEWLPLHVGAAPQALLAALPDLELNRYLASGGEWKTRQGSRNPEEIRQGVDEIRLRGWSLNREGITQGVASLGAVVKDASGSAICAISVAGLEHHYIGEQLERTAAKVVEAARQAAERLPAPGR